MKEFILPILSALQLETCRSQCVSQSPWIHPSLVLDVLTLSQVSLRQKLHSMLPRNSNKGLALVFVLLPPTHPMKKQRANKSVWRALLGSPCSVYTHSPVPAAGHPTSLSQFAQLAAQGCPVALGTPGRAPHTPGGEGWTQ